MNFQQYMNAYPQLPTMPTPGTAYGWAGSGFGWQIDPSSWQVPSLYPRLDDVVEEPPIVEQKVEKQEVSKKNIYVNIRLRATQLHRTFRSGGVYQIFET